MWGEEGEGEGGGHGYWERERIRSILGPKQIVSQSLAILFSPGLELGYGSPQSSKVYLRHKLHYLNSCLTVTGNCRS